MWSRRSASVPFLVVALVATLLPWPDADPVRAAAAPPPGDQSAQAPAVPGTFRGAASAATAAILQVTVNKPAGLTANDVMVAAISINELPTITAPSGWTHLRTESAGTTMRQALYWKVAGGSEPTSYTWTFDTGVDSAAGVITAWSGVNTATPIDVSGGQSNPSGTSVTAPSVTTTVANTMLIGFFGTGTTATFLPPSGMTERADQSANGQGQVSVEAASVAKASSGATGTKVATASAAAENIGQLVALRPSGTIAHRATAAGATSAITSLAVGKPAGTVADDVLLAAVTSRGAVTITAPAGWTQVRADQNGGALTQTVFVRTASASEGSTYTFTFNGPISSAVGSVLAYAGMDAVNPIDVSGGQANASSTTVTAPSITITVADAMLVGVFGTANDATFIAPSGFTERTDILVTAANDVSAMSADSTTQASPGATGAKTATASKAGANIGQLIALRPAGATANLGQQAQHTLESWDLGSGDSLSVNALTRNAVISHPVVSLKIRGSSFGMVATYNAKDPANVGMGPGWRLDVFRRLRLNADGSVTFTDGSGARHGFTNPVTVGSVTTYTRPATLYATLVKDTAQAVEFTLTYRDQARDTFDISGTDGLLIRAQDRFGNGVTVAYAGGTTNITTITDTAASPSRVINVTWDTAPAIDRLTQIQDWAYVSGGVVQTTNTGTRRAYRFHYDAGTGALAGWSNPIDASGSCPTMASHRTCLVYTNGLLTGVKKKLTRTTLSAGSLGTAAIDIQTEIAYAGSDVATVTDAEEQSKGTPARTLFTAESATRIRVDRPTTTTWYEAVAPGDAYGRVQSVIRKWDATTNIETRTTYDATYPIEPATVVANYGAVLSTPSRTTTYTYQPTSLGLLSRIVEPLNGTDNRQSDFVYNANNDLTEQTVSLNGGAARTVTRSCYDTDPLCPTTATGLTMRRQIENYVSGGATDEDTNVASEYSYDAYGQLTRVTRHNRNGAGSSLDDRQTGYTYDDKGNQLAAIENYVDGVVTANSDDTKPNATTGARTDLTTTYTYDTAGNQVSAADPRRAIAAASATHVRDTFGRTVVDGWGTADTGGSYTSTNATFDAASGVGTIALSSATNSNGYLTSVSARDVELLAKVKLNKLAAGSDPFTWFYLRRQDSSNYYQARIKFNTNTNITVLLVRTAGGSDTTLGASTTGIQHTTSDWYWVRVRLEGTTSTNAKFRLWKDGTSEPGGWMLDVSDPATPAALQGNGHFGVRFQVPAGWSGGFPVVASYDEFSLTSVGGGGTALGADDYVSRSTFDALNQPLTSKTPTTPGVVITQQTATSTYDELGAVRSATDFGGVVTASEYDRAGRPTKTFEDPPPAGSAYQTGAATFDADGRLLTAKDQRQVADANLGTTTTVYDALGRTWKATDAASSIPDAASETRTEYDALDRVVATEVGYGTSASQRTEFALDIGGRITETDDGFTCATATFDYRDLATSQMEGLTGGTCTAGTTRTLANTYDGLGRLTRIEVTAGPDSGDRPTDVTLDSVGNTLTAAVKKAGVTTTTTFTPNLLDQVQAEVRADGSTAKRTFDAAGNITDACFWASGTAGACLPVGTTGWGNPPTSSTSSVSDARNGPISLTDSLANQTTTYDAVHNYLPAAVYTPTLADGSREHQALYTYDTRHRLTGITQQLCTVSAGHACSATVATASNTYEYDDADNRTKVVEHNGAASTDRRYCYDARGQLLYRNTGAACSAGANDEAFTYDDTGNRLTATEGGVTRTFAYTPEGALCDVETAPTAASCTGGNVSTDSAGRISAYGGWWYGYDAEGRMVSACRSATCAAGSDRLEFSYDGEGNRTKITETPASGSPVTREFRYQGGAVVQEKTGGVVVRDHVVGSSGTITKVIIPAGQADAGTYLPVWNGHGDLASLWRMNADGTLTLANSVSYGTWGTPTLATHNGIGDLAFRYRYVGAADVQWDDTYGAGLLYMHARHYSPTLGRFLQPDPARAEANHYAYAGNNPVSRVDPSGLCGIPCKILEQLQRLGNWLNSTRAWQRAVEWLTAMRNSPAPSQIARKLDFAFGKAKGTPHNIKRSQDNLIQLRAIGISDNPAGRRLLLDFFTHSSTRTRNIEESILIPGTQSISLTRVDLLKGPLGQLRAVSVWHYNPWLSGGQQLITFWFEGKGWGRGR